MKKLTKLTYACENIDAVARSIKQKMNGCQIVTFSGPLGAGKTTLIKELLAQWGVRDMVTSPTFTYLNRYTNAQGQVFYHFDLYRISSMREFQEAGFEEYLYEPGSYTLIEWPEHIVPLLKHACHVKIDYHTDPQKRVITITS